MRRQCQKTPRMGITRHEGSRSMAGVHWKRLGRGHKILLVCTKEGREGNRSQHLYPVLSFRGCLANTHETHPVTSYPFSQLIYRWVLRKISSFLSLCSRWVWELKLPQTCWGVGRFHSRHQGLLTLPYQICFSLLDTPCHTHYTCITQSRRIGAKTLKFLRCPSSLYNFSLDLLLPVHFHSHTHHSFPQDTQHPIHPVLYLTEWFWATQQRWNFCINAFCQRKQSKELKDAFMCNPEPTLECRLLFFRAQLAPPDLFLQQRLCAVQGQVLQVFLSSH